MTFIVATALQNQATVTKVIILKSIKQDLLKSTGVFVFC